MHTQNWRPNSRSDQALGPAAGPSEEPRDKGNGHGERAGDNRRSPGGEHGPISGEDSQSYSRQRTPGHGGYGHGSSNHGYGENNSGYAERNPGRSDRGLSSLRSGDNMVDFSHGRSDAARSSLGTGLAGRPFQGKGPRNYSRSNERIREDVCEYLSEGFLDASDIEVAVSEGVVTLTGTVTDRRSKLVAEELAESVLGVRDVDNRLRIAPPLTTSRHEDREQPGFEAAPQAGQGELHAAANEPVAAQPVAEPRSLPRATA